jgi:hypothetical protein
VTGGLVSVVMPAFDEERFIGEAVASVLAQTYRSFELIVVDDGSSDQTAAIAAGFGGVRVVRRASTGGPAAARNAGLAEARGEYWTIFDADDVMPPERLALGVACLEANLSVGLVLGLTEAFVTPGEPRPSHWNPAWDAGPYQGHRAPGWAAGPCSTTSACSARRWRSVPTCSGWQGPGGPGSPSVGLRSSVCVTGSTPVTPPPMSARTERTC